MIIMSGVPSLFMSPNAAPRATRGAANECPISAVTSWNWPLPALWKTCAGLAALLISTFEEGCRFVSGLLPLRFARMEKLFSDGVLWHVAELIEDCKNGRPADVTFL